ncbi:unnamed protein product [[Candida] boidinii]|nr:unnamed protein product [[Candida] boidinii]
MTTTPTNIGDNNDSSKTKSISPNTSPSPRNSISIESTGEDNANSSSVINKEESTNNDDSVPTTSAQENNVSFEQESKVEGDEDSDMDVDATATVTPGDSSRGHMRTRSMDYKSK